MGSEKRVRKPGDKALICVALILVAALLVFLGFQCLTTVEYGLYSKNYDYYVSKAAECRELANGEYGESYLLIAQNWEDSAKNALHYLTWHRTGAISLFVAGALAVALGIWSVIPKKKKETTAVPDVKPEAKQKN